MVQRYPESGEKYDRTLLMLLLKRDKTPNSSQREERGEGRHITEKP
jgi:hypothetical protein